MKPKTREEKREQEECRNVEEAGECDAKEKIGDPRKRQTCMKAIET